MYTGHISTRIVQFFPFHFALLTARSHKKSLEPVQVVLVQFHRASRSRDFSRFNSMIYDFISIKRFHLHGGELTTRRRSPRALAGPAPALLHLSVHAHVCTWIVHARARACVSALSRSPVIRVCVAHRARISWQRVPTRSHNRVIVFTVEPGFGGDQARLDLDLDSVAQGSTSRGGRPPRQCRERADGYALLRISTG